MDRTSRIGVAVCLAILVYLFFFAAPPPLKPRPAPATTSPALTATTPGSPTTQPAIATPSKLPPAPTTQQLAFLENDNIRATFTSLGAAIKQVTLKKHKEDGGGNVVLNEQSHTNVMQLTGWPGADALNFQVQQTPQSLVYTTTLANGVNWERIYTLGKDYALTVKDTLTNPGAAEVILPSYGLSVGRAEPLRVGGHYQQASNMYMGCGWLTSGKFRLTTVNDFNPGFIPLVGIKTMKERIISTAGRSIPLRCAGSARRINFLPSC